MGIAEVKLDRHHRKLEMFKLMRMQLNVMLISLRCGNQLTLSPTESGPLCIQLLPLLFPPELLPGHKV